MMDQAVPWRPGAVIKMLRGWPWLCLAIEWMLILIQVMLLLMPAAGSGF